MKQLKSFSVFLGSVLATLLLAVGFTNAAQKLDPVAQKSETISSVETGEIASLPCVGCTTGGGSGGGSGGGGFTDGSDRQFHA